MKIEIPAVNPLKKLYSVNNGLVNLNIFLGIFCYFLILFIVISRKLLLPNSPFDEILTNCLFQFFQLAKVFNFSETGIIWYSN